MSSDKLQQFVGFKQIILMAHNNRNSKCHK